MKIEFLGHSCFLIESEKGTSILTDPFDGVGFPFPKGLSVDLLTVSHAHFDHANVDAVRAEKVISSVGDFAVKDVEASGFSCDHDEKGGTLRGKCVAYIFTVDGIKICHVGDLGEPCEEGILSKLSGVDVLLLPVGGRYTIDGAEAVKYVQNVRPKCVIPMHYKTEGLSLDIATNEAFLRGVKAIGYKEETADALILDKETLGENRVCILKRVEK